MKSSILVKLLAIGLPTCLVVTVIGFVLLVAALGVLRALLRARAYASAAASTPAVPAVHLWTLGAMGLWTGGEDSASWTQQRARDSLGSWYGARDPAAFWTVIDGLREGQTGNPAWDQVRAIDLIRIGVAAGYCTADEGYAVTRSIAADLRPIYHSWEELAAGFEEGMLAWHDSRGVTSAAERGRVARNLPHLRAAIWPTVGFTTPL